MRITMLYGCPSCSGLRTREGGKWEARVGLVARIGEPRTCPNCTRLADLQNTVAPRWVIHNATPNPSLFYNANGTAVYTRPRCPPSLELAMGRMHNAMRCVVEAGRYTMQSPHAIDAWTTHQRAADYGLYLRDEESRSLYSRQWSKAVRDGVRALPPPGPPVYCQNQHEDE